MNYKFKALIQRLILSSEKLEIMITSLCITDFSFFLFFFTRYSEEAAISLGKREDLIKRSVEWCATEDHPGVQGEANRLIAWLIKNSRSVL